MNRMKIVLMGIGGWGAGHMDALLCGGAEMNAELAGVVQPGAETRHAKALKALHEAKIPVVDSLGAFFDDLHLTCDAVIISTPIQYHFEQCYEALSRGCHVLCEKPLVSDWPQAVALERLADEKNLQLGVGYQWCFSAAMRRLKQDVMGGRYGRAVSMRSLTLLGRPNSYYARNRWAGKFFDDEGRSIQDGVLHNAAAHDLQAMLYLLGEDGVDSAAEVTGVRGEWCRVHDIASYDTAVCKVSSKQDVPVLIAASHAWAGRDERRFRYVWEHGYAEGCWSRGAHLVVHADDREIDYGSVDQSVKAELAEFIRCIQTGEKLPCSVHAAKEEVAVCTGLYLSAGRVTSIPAWEQTLVRGAPNTSEEGDIFPTSQRLTALLELCYQKSKLPCELGNAFGNDPLEVGMAQIKHGLAEG